MKKAKEFNNILDECLERLLVKGEPIEQCLQSYPEHAAELEPLLQTAVATKKALAIQPHPEFKARARYQFQSALQEVKPRRALPLLGWQPQWAVAIAIVISLFMVGGGTVAAAGYSMPDSPLYTVKLATEQVQLTLTTSDIGKAKLYANLADRRVAEIVYIVNKGKLEQIEPTVRRLNKHLAVMASLPLAGKGERRDLPAKAPVTLAPPEEAPVPQQEAEVEGKGRGGEPAPASEKGKLRMLLKRNAVNHPAILSAVLEKVPESAKPALRRAIAVSASSYEKALNALD